MAFSKIMAAVKKSAAAQGAVRDRQPMQSSASFLSRVQRMTGKVAAQGKPLKRRLAEAMPGTPPGDPAPATEMQSRRNLRSMIGRISGRASRIG